MADRFALALAARRGYDVLTPCTAYGLVRAAA